MIWKTVLSISTPVTIKRNMLDNAQVPVIGFAAWSGAGKTTLLKQIIPLLNARHLRTGIIKHTHHQFEIDIPGKDSYELRHAGAQQTLIAADKRWALITENKAAVEPDLNKMIGKLDQTELDEFKKEIRAEQGPLGNAFGIERTP